MVGKYLKNDNFVDFLMLGFRGTNSETSKCQSLALYKSCFYTLHADLQFGFCKNTEKLPNNKSSDLQASLL